MGIPGVGCVDTRNGFPIFFVFKKKEELQPTSRLLFLPVHIAFPISRARISGVLGSFAALFFRTTSTKQLTVVTQYPTIRVTLLHPIIFNVFEHICFVHFIDKSVDYGIFILDYVPIFSGYLIWYQEGELAWVYATGSLLIFFLKG
jgi:hypothetical protein